MMYFGNLKIVITDTGMFCNPKHPILQEYRKDVICVHLAGFGKQDDTFQTYATDWHSDFRGRGMVDTYSRDCLMFQELKKVGKRLYALLRDADDILFLTDCEPSTLYPYNVIKDINTHSNLHLFTMSPWGVMGKKKATGHKRLLSDLEMLKSFLYIDSDKKFPFTPETDIWNVEKRVNDYLWIALPYIIEKIRNQGAGKYFYDPKTKQYISTEQGIEKANEDLNDPYRIVAYVGHTDIPRKNINLERKELIISQSPRLDGKDICNSLKEKRMELARLNSIPYEDEICKSEGPCAGTCPKCDEDAEYLRKELEKIPKEKRHYPKIDVRQEVLLWKER